MRNYIDYHKEWENIYQDDGIKDLQGLRDLAKDLKNTGNGLDLSDFEDDFRDDFMLEDIYDVYDVEAPFNEYKAYKNFYNKKGKDNMNELELLDKVTDAATFLYVKNMGDKVAPNILISKLPNKQCYVSLNRYITPSDRFKKTIMFKTTKQSSKDALMDVAKFLAKQKIVKTTNPLEELEILIEEDNLDCNI